MSFPLGSANEQISKYKSERKPETMFVMIKDYGYEGGYEFKGLFKTLEKAKEFIGKGEFIFEVPVGILSNFGKPVYIS